MIYLASPYTSPDSAVMERRYKDVSLAAHRLNKAGLPVISPISHWHPVAVEHDLATDADTWATINFGWLKSCKVLAILALEGWEDSKGIMLEEKWANELGMPIAILRPQEKLLWEGRLKRLLKNTALISCAS